MSTTVLRPREPASGRVSFQSIDGCKPDSKRVSSTKDVRNFIHRETMLAPTIKDLASPLTLLLLTCFSFSAANAEDIKHSVLIAGGFTGIIDEDGKEIWKTQGNAKDATQFADGNILITYKDKIVEFDKERKQIWKFDKPKTDSELITAWRLEKGNTMIVILGNKPRIIEVDPDGKELSTTPVDPEQMNNHHMQTRMARKLSNGNYIAPHLFGFSVREYTPTGKVIADFQTDTEHFGGQKTKNWPFTAIRTPDKTTVVGCTYGNRVVEFDKDGKIIWELTNKDVGGIIKDACGVQRLPNGNTVITSYGQRQKDAVKIFEVNKEKKVVWSYKNHYAHHFQILTTNGKKLDGNPMK